MADFRLKMELVPEPLWGVNLRSDKTLGDSRWRKLRKSLLEEQGSACAICGSIDKPHAHEVWDYEEGALTGAATLVRIEFICHMCNFVHHFGMTQRLLLEGRISEGDLRNIKKHFCKVNNCKTREFEAHKAASDDEWRRRSDKKWSIDYGPYSAAVREASARRR